ncbi:hypothetical protein, partial [Klebsiella pneumoniae]|uniref:hypothetical protein n=1 Tax=Klebsiella pneumoniae TaxID=573 RepID=UPI002731E377
VAQRIGLDHFGAVDLLQFFHLEHGDSSGLCWGWGRCWLLFGEPQDSVQLDGANSRLGLAITTAQPKAMTLNPQSGRAPRP